MWEARPIEKNILVPDCISLLSFVGGQANGHSYFVALETLNQNW